MKIYYENSSGKTLDFMRWPYKVSESEILGYEWSYTGTENTGNKSGGSLSSIRKKIAKTTLTLAVSGHTKEAHMQALENLLAVTEADILAGNPGKLYVDDYYYLCYVYASTKKEWGQMTTYAENKLKLVSPYPFWCREKTKSFLKGNPATEENTDDYLFYPFAYPYRYSMPRDAGFIDNDHYAACDFRLIIYGPCDNPEIRINGHLYKVTVHLAAGDYLEIDSRDNTVYQVKLDGRRINLFNQRDKESGIFEKIPTGRCSVYWATEGFGFDLTLFQERSEPVWNLL